MKVLKLLTLLLIPSFLFAQGPIYQKIQDAKARSASTEFNLVTAAGTNLRSSDIPERELKEGLLLDLNPDQINELLSNNSELIKMNFPLPNQLTLTVDLVENKVLFDDFIFRVSSTRDEISRYAPGKYYHGVINNDPSSLVSISVFKNEIVGLISTSHGNYVIGKLKGDVNGKHIIYNDTDLTTSNPFECRTEDDGIVYTREQLNFEGGSRDIGDCVRIYIEIDDDIVTDKGGTTPATNYITGLFNEVFTIYANDGMSLVISEILAWDTPSPYNGSLTLFQAYTDTFNGDLSHYVSYRGSGGVAAGFAGICNPNPDLSKCFSSIYDTYAVVPTYSWSVMVCAHEMGHLIGSRHTHGCVWNGNGTAIDGCGFNTEGSCPFPVPQYPPGGGTIMSYCHLRPVGINLSLGFGPQPTSVLLWTINNATCLSACSGPDSCHDGIQNGDETGVDCGGSLCEPCPTCSDNIQNGNETGVDCGGSVCEPCPCNGGQNIIVAITFDNYAFETTWTIRDANNSIVAQGGTYGVPNGSSVSETVCLEYGCYSFTIYDDFGDGICCANGNGSYMVTDGNNNVLASGGSFGLSEMTNFCICAPPVAVCQDITVQLDANGDASITANDVNDGSSVDPNCSSFDLSVSPSSFDCNNLGDNPVTLSVTDNSGNQSSCNATVTVEDAINPCSSCDEYVIISEENMEIEETTVHSGGIGVLNEDEEAKIDDNSMVVAAGTFVKAPEVEVKDGSQVNVIIEEQADPNCMPEFLYNPHSSNNDVDVDEDETVILDEAIYDDIEVEDGATVIFSGHQDVYIEDFETGEEVTVIFDQCTNLRVENEFRLGEETDFNTANENVAVFAGDKIAFEGRNIAKGLFYTMEELIIHKAKSYDRNQLYGQFIGREVDAFKYTDFYYQLYMPCNLPIPMNGHAQVDIFADELTQPTNDGKKLSKFKVAPNPFNTETNISFELDQEDQISIEIYNLNGQLIKQLFNGIQSSGSNQLSWDGNSDDGNKLENGIYFIVLKTSDQVITKKVSLIR